MKKPDKAFILAAGLGTRLRPYTDQCPKPMVRVGGQSLIARALDRLRAAGVREVVVNLHYLAPVLKTHLEEYLEETRKSDPGFALHFSFEPELLDTGGGVKNALAYFEGDTPFYVIAGDSLWEDAPGHDTLLRLAESWDGETMDILTLLQPLEAMKLTGGVGDYDLNEIGLPERRPDKGGRYMWTNIRLNHPRIYRDAPEGAFSFLALMDRAERQGRLHALVHEGAWHHISTPGDLERVDAHIAAQRKKA